MPTQTFFRLPEEKRERLIAAAWEEFSTTRFSAASINRIVRDAQIPRGSFYQYFEDKEDLFIYLFGSVREEAFLLMRAALAETGGEPFRASLRLFDDVFQGDGRVRPSMERVVRVLRLNQNMDVSQMLLSRLQADDGFCEIERRDIDWSGFRQTDPAFLSDVAALLVLSFACSIRNILCAGASVASEREKLCTRLEVLRRGSMKGEMVS
ncbi:MAG: TetR/AcrR family transcriptional regulator [Oscillospiraceae bacterium]|nr:TetR/AcrR family transcriptional regulator [Oscillospiraceae bacterium]